MADDDGVDVEDWEDALWRLATSLAGSVTIGDVVESLVNEGGPTAGGTFTNLALLHPYPDRVRIVHHSYTEEGLAGTREFDVEAAVPACEAIRSGLPVLLGSIDEITRRYPDVLDDVTAAGLSARATMPLHSTAGELLGAIGIGWQHPQDFDAQQLRRLDLLAQLAALAVERSPTVEPDRDGKQLLHALETMPNALFTVGTDFCIIEVNGEGTRLLHSTRNELKGKNLLDLELAGPEFEAQCRKAMALKQPALFEVYNKPLAAWLEIRAWPARPGLNIVLSDVSHRHDGDRQRPAAATAATGDPVAGADINQFKLLTVVAERLVGSTDRDEVFQRLTQVLVPGMADWCTIVTPSDDALVRVAARHIDPPRDALAQRLVGSYPHSYSGPSPGVVVYRSGEPLRLAHLVEEINQDLDDSSASGDPYSDEDVAVMAEVASHVAVALISADHVQSQREMARALQAAALPGSLPVSEELHIAAGYRAASDGGQIGGDWYDSFELESGRIPIAVGDVAGHGVGAAALTAQMRNVLRAHLFSGIGPLQSLSRLSRLIATQEPDALATIVCAEVDPSTGEVTWASAGHPAPIVVSIPEHSVHLAGRPVPPIGCTVRSRSQAKGEHHLTLEPGARLILFTDGLYERRCVDLDIGLAHLMILAEQSLDLPRPEDACEFILDGMLSGGHEDDACLLIAQRR
jgi:serine phosphatase RsbU (regulator of sigma subunit)/PAS domain-containing protein